VPVTNPNKGRLRQFASEEASIADRLQADLSTLGQILGNYSAGRRGGEVAELQRQSSVTLKSLEALSGRLDGLGAAGAEKDYRLSPGENEQVAIARTLRDTIMDTIGELQRDQSSH
jgi:hypothetical protein